MAYESSGQRDVDSPDNLASELTPIVKLYPQATGSHRSGQTDAATHRKSNR